jgi:hypothetical protein
MVGLDSTKERNTVGTNVPAAALNRGGPGWVGSRPEAARDELDGLDVGARDR